VKVEKWAKNGQMVQNSQPLSPPRKLPEFREYRLSPSPSQCCVNECVKQAVALEILKE
jgi:hypothetical protein